MSDTIVDKVLQSLMRTPALVPAECSVCPAMHQTQPGCRLPKTSGLWKPFCDLVGAFFVTKGELGGGGGPGQNPPVICITEWVVVVVADEHNGPSQIFCCPIRSSPWVCTGPMGASFSEMVVRQFCPPPTIEFLVEIVILRGRDLPRRPHSPNSAHSNEPFVAVSIGDQSFRTSLNGDDRNPDWNERILTFLPNDGSAETVTLAVYEDDASQKMDLIGRQGLALKPQPVNKYQEVSLALLGPDEAPSGFLDLLIKKTDRRGVDLYLWGHAFRLADPDGHGLLSPGEARAAHCILTGGESLSDEELDAFCGVSAPPMPLGTGGTNRQAPIEQPQTPFSATNRAGTAGGTQGRVFYWATFCPQEASSPTTIGWPTAAVGWPTAAVGWLRMAVVLPRLAPSEETIVFSLCATDHTTPPQG